MAQKITAGFRALVDAAHDTGDRTKSHTAKSGISPAAGDPAVPVTRGLRRLAEDPHKTFPDLAVRLHDMRLERGEIRQIGNSRQQRKHAGIR